MAQITTADVTYSLISASRNAGPSDPMRKAAYAITFGGTGNTNYPLGGVPLSPGKLGCPATIQEFLLMDEGSTVGYVAKYDFTAMTIRLYWSNQGTVTATLPLIELTTAATISSVTIKARVGGW